MKTNQTRRKFLQLSGAGIAAGLISGVSPVNARTAPQPAGADRKLAFGMASYTFRNFTLQQTIAMTKRLGIKQLSLKDVHLPLTLSKEEIKKAVDEIQAAGLHLYAAGVIYMTNEAEVNGAFEYAKNAGLEIIVGVPEHALLPLAEKKAKEYNINLAIHNHGPTDKRYPSPESVFEKIKNMDPRVGLCLDIGHTCRMGIDPSEAAEKYASRLMDVHIKDESAATAEGTTIEIGRGVIDIPKFLKTLLRLKYKGIVSFEFEKDKEDPLAGVAESVGYVNGVLATL
ncbi:MAG: sugar phosphate isomerase/epimerase [Ignavibacteriales bacterium]|nr:sugar phosphate isomerase/epimerase [Ignavibacteriales bacterium]